MPISDDMPCAKILHAKTIREFLKYQCVQKMAAPKFIFDHTDEAAWEQAYNTSKQKARVRMRTYITKVKNKTLSGGILACDACKYS